MENSKAYNYLFEQIHATGVKKRDGYYPRIMEEIYEWEREEVEDVIWKKFHENRDIDLAIFLPKLRKYDGIEALKKALFECIIPSDSSVMICQILYQFTDAVKYLDIIKQNIDKEPDKISYVSVLSYCKPSKKAYDLLVDIYINSTNKTIRSTAVTGILYNKNLIKNPLDLQEMMANLNLERKFDSEDIHDRKNIIELFESGQL